MTPTISTPWEAKRTDETRGVEEHLRKSFDQVDAYRYNSASIRVRVITDRFEGMDREGRYTLVEDEIDKLPPDTQSDIVTLLVFAPSELSGEPRLFLREQMLNAEFEDPSPSEL